MTSAAAAIPLEASLREAFHENRRLLFGLCYRMTGSAADAEDLVQETFVRAMQHPPSDRESPLRPWLVKVALNLGRDALRRRKRQGYPGPWLPSPIEVEEAGEDPDSRYGLLESVSFAFLLALEALSPTERAALLLRDVFDYSARETALALGISEGNVRTTHHRARRAMARYERSRPAKAIAGRNREVLERFLDRLAGHDVAGIERLLAEDVRVVTDGGGEVVAALKPIVGRAKAMGFLLAVAASGRAGTRAEVRLVNGSPAVVVELRDAGPRLPARLVFRVDLDLEGRVAVLHVVAAPRKLTAISAIAPLR